MKLTYTEYNSLFNSIEAAIKCRLSLPPVTGQWRDYAIVVEDVLKELNIKHCFVGSVKANRLNKQPVYMGNDIKSLPHETAQIVNEWQHETSDYKAVFRTVHADQCHYLLFAI